MVPRKRFSKFRLLGTSQLGYSDFGEDDLYFNRTGYGKVAFGVNKFGDIVMLSGIYRTNNVTGKTKYYREPFYITKNPRTPSQQANRAKMADAVLAWQGLTIEQKVVYNKKAIGKKMSGYNFFLKEYLLSH